MSLLITTANVIPRRTAIGLFVVLRETEAVSCARGSCSADKRSEYGRAPALAALERVLLRSPVGPSRTIWGVLQGTMLRGHRALEQMVGFLVLTELSLYWLQHVLCTVGPAQEAVLGGHAQGLSKQVESSCPTVLLLKVLREFGRESSGRVPS